MSEKCHSLIRDHNGRFTAQIATLSHEFDDAARVVPEHSHSEDQLIFASKGVMRVRTRQGIWIVPPLRAVWIPAGTSHSITMAGRVSLRTLYLKPGLAHEVSRECFVMSVSPLLRELILHACKFEKLTVRKSAHQRIIAILVDQLEEARVIPLQLPYPIDTRSRRVAEMLLANPAEERDAEQLGHACGVSKRTLERLFVMDTGMTFGKWRQQLRLLHAMQALAAGENVTTAAIDVGYSSPSAFIAMFREHLGMTPSRYFERSDAPAVADTKGVAEW